MEEIGINNKKKMLRALFVVFLVLTILTGRISYIQFAQGANLQKLAYEQQVQERLISAKRGIIYDSTEKYMLAISSTVSTVTVNPTNIIEKDKEKVASKLSDLFNLDYETVLKKVSKRSSIETFVKKV